MPALPPVPQVLKCQFVHSLQAVTSAFVHVYLRYAGTAPSANDLNNAAGAMSTAWNTNFASLCTTAYSLTNVNVTDLTSPTAAQGTNAVVHAGTRTGGGLTANDCMLVDQKIARRYRGGKPRQYWPFGVAGDIGGFTWLAGFLTAAGTGVTGFNNALLAIAWSGGNVSQIVNVSYFAGFHVVTNLVTGRARNVPTLRPGGPVIDPVTNHLVNTRVATQRRRQHFSA